MARGRVKSNERGITSIQKSLTLKTKDEMNVAPSAPPQ